MGLGGLSGLGGIVPRATTPSSFNWALMPNVPAGRRSAIEAACTAASIGQSFTASDVFSFVATAAYWWSFEPGSVFTSTDTSALSTATGDAIGCARDWIQNALITQAAVANRPARASIGLDFDGVNDSLFSGSIALIPNSINPYTACVVGAPLRVANTKGGALLLAGMTGQGSQSGFGIGCGTGTKIGRAHV
jgi:hypothetical protein